jgi:hypothetical protein
MYLTNNNFLKRKNISTISISLIFTEFYYFNLGSKALISNTYLFLNSLILLLTSLLFFYLIITIFEKINKKFSQEKLKYFIVVLLTFVYFKIIQIPFFFANQIHFKSLISNILTKIPLSQIYPLIPILKIIIPFISLFIIILYFYEKRSQIILNFILSFSLIFLMFALIDINKRKSFLNNVSLKDNISANNRQVIWFLLDEYDPEYIDQIEHGIELKYIKDLKSKSFNHNNSFTPSSSTLLSVPSTFMKTLTKGSVIIDYELNIIDTKNNKKKFEFKNTIFNEIYSNNNNFEIFTEVLPYCSMLKIKLNCHQFSNRKMFFLDGVKNIFFPIQYLKNISYKISKKNKFSINQINQFKEMDDSNILLSSKLNISFDDFKKLIKKNNLIFFHLFAPHTKTSSSKYIQQTFNNITPNNDDEEYLLNLKFTDFLINKIVKTINESQNKDILLILSSDHWRRSTSPDKSKPSLLLMKIKSDNSKIEFFKYSSNIYIYDVVEKYLSGEISSHKDIQFIFDNAKRFNINDTYIKK